MPSLLFFSFALGGGGCLDMFEDWHVCSVLFLLKPEALWDTPFVCVWVCWRDTRWQDPASLAHVDISNICRRLSLSLSVSLSVVL